MLRPTLALLALLIPQGLLASEVHVSSSGLDAELAPLGAFFHTAGAPARSVTVQPFQKDALATPVRFDVDTLRPIRLEVLTPQGEVVRTLASGLWAAGRHELAWYGVDEEDAVVADGPYSLRLTLVDEIPAVAFAEPAD